MLVDVLLHDHQTFSSVIRAMLSPLAYRVLRCREGLGFETAVEQTASAVAKILDVPLTTISRE
jgi:hypothetical protein